MRLKVR